MILHGGYSVCKRCYVWWGWRGHVGEWTKSGSVHGGVQEMPHGLEKAWRKWGGKSVQGFLPLYLPSLPPSAAVCGRKGLEWLGNSQNTENDNHVTAAVAAARPW